MSDSEDINELIQGYIDETNKNSYPYTNSAIKERYIDTSYVIYKKGKSDFFFSKFLSFGTRRASSVSSYGNTPIFIRRSVSSSGAFTYADQATFQRRNYSNSHSINSENSTLPEELEESISDAQQPHKNYKSFSHYDLPAPDYKISTIKEDFDNIKRNAKSKDNSQVDISHSCEKKFESDTIEASNTIIQKAPTAYISNEEFYISDNSPSKSLSNEEYIEDRVKIDSKNKDVTNFLNVKVLSEPIKRKNSSGLSSLDSFHKQLSSDRDSLKSSQNKTLPSLTVDKNKDLFCNESYNLSTSSPSGDICNLIVNGAVQNRKLHLYEHKSDSFLPGIRCLAENNQCVEGNQTPNSINSSLFPEINQNCHKKGIINMKGLSSSRSLPRTSKPRGPVTRKPMLSLGKYKGENYTWSSEGAHLFANSFQKAHEQFSKSEIVPTVDVKTEMANNRSEHEIEKLLPTFCNYVMDEEVNGHDFVSNSGNISLSQQVVISKLCSLM